MFKVHNDSIAPGCGKLVERLDLQSVNYSEKVTFAEHYDDIPAHGDRTRLPHLNSFAAR